MSDLISRQAAINAICEDGTRLERQGKYTMTMAERKQRDADILDALPSAQQWISCTPETMPENEQDVLVTVEVRPFGRKPYRRVVRAFYADGKHTDADSAYSWDEFPDPQYDDEDNLMIPEGLWESSDY